MCRNNALFELPILMSLLCSFKRTLRFHKGSKSLGDGPLRWGYCLGPKAPLIRECRLGRRYFWSCRARVGSGLASDPPKRPCATLARSVGRATNTAAPVISTLPVFVYVEPRKPSSGTWIHLCGTSYLCYELFIY